MVVPADLANILHVVSTLRDKLLMVVYNTYSGGT